MFRRIERGNYMAVQEVLRMLEGRTAISRDSLPHAVWGRKARFSFLISKTPFYGQPSEWHVLCRWYNTDRIRADILSPLRTGA